MTGSTRALLLIAATCVVVMGVVFLIAGMMTHTLRGHGGPVPKVHTVLILQPGVCVQRVFDLVPSCGPNRNTIGVAP